MGGARWGFFGAPQAGNRVSAASGKVQILAHAPRGPAAATPRRRAAALDRRTIASIIKGEKTRGKARSRRTKKDRAWSKSRRFSVTISRFTNSIRTTQDATGAGLRENRQQPRTELRHQCRRGAAKEGNEPLGSISRQSQQGQRKLQ
jgi:hypothetical protein